MLKKIMGAPALAVLLAFLSGCPSGDSGTSAYKGNGLIIRNIPRQIEGQDVYKIFVNLSDSTDQNQSHKAQGTLTLDGSEFANGKATVTVELWTPKGSDMDPDDHGGERFMGSAKALQVTICPASAPSSASIEAKGAYGFTGSVDWDKMVLVDIIPGSKQGIYNRIICLDKDSIGTGIKDTQVEP